MSNIIKYGPAAIHYLPLTLLVTHDAQILDFIILCYFW